MATKASVKKLVKAVDGAKHNVESAAAALDGAFKDAQINYAKFKTIAQGGNFKLNALVQAKKLAGELMGNFADIASAQGKLAAFKTTYSMAIDAAEQEIIAYTTKATATAKKTKGAAAASPAAGAAAVKLEDYAFPDDKAFDPNKAKVISASIGGSTGAKLVEINGNKYIMKTDNKVSKEHILNEAAADKMYRAAGIRVPDCKTYQVGGKTYKLAEFIEGGQSLGDYLATAGAAEKARIRQEMLKGYQIDVVVGNWDVCGMSKDNVLIDKHGNVWRIDNGSAMGFRATGARKDAAAWDKAEFPDEWRTMRDPNTGSNNKGVFDGYTAHDIFSKEVDWDAVLAATPKSEYKIVEKRVNEMRQMHERCKDFDRGGYSSTNGKNGDMDTVSAMLEHSYNLSKDGLRERCKVSITGSGHQSNSESTYCFAQTGGAGLPPKPTPPASNWDGTKFSTALTEAAKSVNYHIAQGDFKASASKVNAALALESELKALAKTDKDAQDLLGKLNEIKASQANGFKTKIGMVNAYDIQQSPAAVAQMQAQYQKSLAQWQASVSAGKASPYESFTDEMQQRIESVGGDKEWNTKWSANMGTHSWEKDAQIQKFVEMAMRGQIDVNAKLDSASFKKLLKSENIFWNNKTKLQGRRVMTIDEAVAEWNSIPVGERKRKLIASEVWRAGQTIFFENATMNGNDHENHSLFIVRTTGDFTFNKSVIPNEGWRGVTSNGPMESACWNDVNAIYAGGYRIGGFVPYSNIGNAYIFERDPHSGNHQFVPGGGESEFATDFAARETYYIGASGGYDECMNKVLQWDAARGIKRKVDR